MNFQLNKHHDYQIETLENMFPFEREVYVALLKEWLEEEHRKASQK